jgi:hypothetical protein
MMTESVADSDLDARLQQVWQALTAEHQGRLKTIEIDHDIARAELLTRFASRGLSHREIARNIGSSKAHVTRLLRYYRYREHVGPHGVRIPESQFRAYWLHMRDPTMTVGKRRIDPGYEHEVFLSIDTWVDAHRPPIKPRQPPTPKTARQIRRAAHPLTALRKEVQILYQREMKPTLDTLQRLLHADRSTYAPSSLADYSVSLDRSVQRLLSLFSEKE